MRSEGGRGNLRRLRTGFVFGLSLERKSGAAGDCGSPPFESRKGWGSVRWGGRKGGQPACRWFRFRRSRGQECPRHTGRGGLPELWRCGQTAGSSAAAPLRNDIGYFPFDSRRGLRCTRSECPPFRKERERMGHPQLCERLLQKQNKNETVSRMKAAWVKLNGLGEMDWLGGAKSTESWS